MTLHCNLLHSWLLAVLRGGTIAETCSFWSSSGLTRCVVWARASGVQIPNCEMRGLTPQCVSSSNAHVSNPGLDVASLPWAGAQWNRTVCPGHSSRTSGLPEALSLGPLQEICQQQPRAKQVKTSARPLSTVQPTRQTPTMRRSLSTGPTTGPPKVPPPSTREPEPEPCYLH